MDTDSNSNSYRTELTVFNSDADGDANSDAYSNANSIAKLENVCEAST